MSLQCLVEKDRYTRRTEGTAKGTMNQNTMWKNSRNKRQKLNQEVQKLKHVKTGCFFRKTTNQRTIPADPGSEDARDFLAQAPTKGLWMPHGKGVKVMQCWRCSVIDTGQGTESVPSSSKETRSWSSSEWTRIGPVPTITSWGRLLLVPTITSWGRLLLVPTITWSQP
ncbi:retinitis pigmentosa 9 protein-like isoform X3 [Oncorhynchus masou masou]|uniref:retinitis pigmentosa 9 protein-like isoform X3 n=1 Tax=Oncorhynchus masou masou TaxID=90313 RepID=UPI0031841038